MDKIVQFIHQYSSKVKSKSAILWLLGATFAAFLLYVIMLAVMFGFMVNPESPDDWHTVSDAVVFGGIIIPLLLPMAILYWRKIRLGTTATKVFTALCTISLIMWLCAELAFFLGLISGRLKSEYLLSFIVDTSILLYLGIFVRISILFSLLVISENNKRAKQIVLLILSFLELALLTLYLFIGLSD